MSKAIRQSNMELLRIVAMLLVLVVHVDFFSIGWPDKNDVISHPVSTFLRIEFESLAIVCVNVFVLISGYFGIRLKIKSICNFLFQIYFIWFFLYILSISVGFAVFSIGNLFSIMIPGWRYGWFIAAYLMLLLFSPMLNSFINCSTKKTLKIYILSFFLIQTIFNWIYPFWDMFNSGYSVISFIGLYLLGRYIKEYKPNLSKMNKHIYILLYVVLSSIIAMIAWTSVRYTGINIERLYCYMMSYASPIVIICSVCLLLFFSKIKIQSKIINLIGASAFSVYLVHIHPSIVDYFKLGSRLLFNNFTTFQYIILISIYIVSIFLISILIDKLRLFVWKLFEPIMDKLLSKFANTFN